MWRAWPRQLTRHPRSGRSRPGRTSWRCASSTSAKQVDTLLWTGVILGLLFTMVNVQRFAAAGAPAFSSTWWTAWLLDPMVSLVLFAVLRAEQITSGHQLPSPA